MVATKMRYTKFKYREYDLWSLPYGMRIMRGYVHIQKGLETKWITIKKIEGPNQREEIKKYISPTCPWKCCIKIKTITVDYVIQRKTERRKQY